MPQCDANWQSMDYMLATVSLLYYRDGMTQEAIARRLGLSRPTIVTYLRRAREEGITEIRIAGAAFSSNRLSRDLCEAFGLADVFIAPTEGADDPDDPKLGVRTVARIGAMALCDIASPGGRIGIAWGETLDLLARAMPNGRIADLSIYQVIGAMRSPLMHAAEYSACTRPRCCRRRRWRRPCGANRSSPSSWSSSIICPVSRSPWGVRGPPHTSRKRDW